MLTERLTVYCKWHCFRTMAQMQHLDKDSEKRFYLMVGAFPMMCMCIANSTRYKLRRCERNNLILSLTLKYWMEDKQLGYLYDESVRQENLQHTSHEWNRLSLHIRSNEAQFKSVCKRSTPMDKVVSFNGIIIILKHDLINANFSTSISIMLVNFNEYRKIKLPSKTTNWIA